MVKFHRSSHYRIVGSLVKYTNLLRFWTMKSATNLFDTLCSMGLLRLFYYAKLI